MIVTDYVKSINISMSHNLKMLCRKKYFYFWQFFKRKNSNTYTKKQNQQNILHLLEGFAGPLSIQSTIVKIFNFLCAAYSTTDTK